MTLALLLGLARRVEQKADLFLSLALAVVVLKTGGVTALLLPAAGPLVFFYVRGLTRAGRRFWWKDLLHFYPLLLVFWLPAWLVLVSIIGYLYLAHRQIEDFYRRLQPVLMDRPRFAFRRLDKMLLLLGLGCALSLLGDAFYLIIAVVGMAMAVGVLLKPDSRVPLSLPVMDRADAREKGRRLKEAVAVNRLYEDPELSLATLAGKLSIPPHELSRIINTGLEKNFNDLINEFRVREIVRKMRDPANDGLTLLGIAYDSGFNSKTTFNRVFKELTGKTPVEYKNSLKNEVPNDKSALRNRVRPVLLRSAGLPYWVPQPSKRNSMIRNYLKVAYRQLRKQKMYAAIKVGGFALGIAACLLIGLYIQGEFHHDSSYPDAERIFRVYGDGQANTGYDWPAPLSKVMQKDFPEVAHAGNFMMNLGVQLRRADQVENTYEEGYLYVDQSFLDVFQFPMVFGDRATALKEPLTMVISQSMADKYYRGRNPIGQVMYIDNDKANPYRISGVMADIPASSHLHRFNFLFTETGKVFWDGEENSWQFYNHHVYVKLKAGTDAVAFENKLNAAIRKNYFAPELIKEGAKNAEQEVQKFHFHLQPVQDINLYSYNAPDGYPHGDIRIVWLFGAIAVFILLIACINFINLSTAKSANRAKEVGLRKVLGSYRSSLINQFLTESVIYSLVSFILGLFTAWLALPFFNRLAAKSLTMPWGEWWLVPCVLISGIFVGILAGVYPAFYLSRFRPVQVLKGPIAGGSKSPLLRNGLVIFQFAISIILIVSTIVIYSQTNFILSRKTGFDRDQVMVLHGTNTLGWAGIKTFKNELSKIASVKSASISDFLPIDNSHRNTNPFFMDGREKLDPLVGAQICDVDDTYLKTLGIKLLEGRTFSYQIATDTTANPVIVNQTLVKQFHLVSPLGKRISNGTIFTIVGVIEDFNFNSLRGDVGPMVLHFGLSPTKMTVKFSGQDVRRVVADVTAVWKKFAPDQEIRYSFLDEEFAISYADVVRTGHVFTSFSGLAIIIACLGLFALSAFMAEQRSKEIGIRKVLGARVQGITALLSIDFLKLVVLAILIA